MPGQVRVRTGTGQPIAACPCPETAKVEAGGCARGRLEAGPNLHLLSSRCIWALQTRDSTDLGLTEGELSSVGAADPRSSQGLGKMQAFRALEETLNAWQDLSASTLLDSLVWQGSRWYRQLAADFGIWQLR